MTEQEPLYRVEGALPKAFVLLRHEDETGVSGTGIVAWGVEFPDGVVALRWKSEWPTSVVFHDRGIEAVKAVHGHNGKTEIVWSDKAAAGEGDPTETVPVGTTDHLEWRLSEAEKAGEALAEALREIAESYGCCETPRCSEDDPKCIGSHARKALEDWERVVQ